MLRYRDLLHLGDHGIAAADREQSQLEKSQEQPRQLFYFTFCSIF